MSVYLCNNVKVKVLWQKLGGRRERREEAHSTGCLSYSPWWGAPRDDTVGEQGEGWCVP